MDFDDIKASHEVDQALAESIELGNIRLAGKNEQGQDLLELTAKGVTRTVAMMIEQALVTADAQKRDFTASERHELVGHLLTAITALQK